MLQYRLALRGLAVHLMRDLKLIPWDQVIEKVKAQGTRPLIRISSTFFWHLSSDYDLEPIQSLQTQAVEVRQKAGEDETEVQTYEKMKVGTQVQK